MQHFNRWWLSIWCVHRKNFFSVFYVTRDKKKRKEKIVSKKRMFIWSFCSMFVEHDSLKLSHVRQSFDFEIGVRWKDLICFVLFCFQSSLSFLQEVFTLLLLRTNTCYSCDVASSKLRRSRTTFNKSLVNFTLIAASHIKLRKA